MSPEVPRFFSLNSKAFEAADKSLALDALSQSGVLVLGEVLTEEVLAEPLPMPLVLCFRSSGRKSLARPAPLGKLGFTFNLKSDNKK